MRKIKLILSYSDIFDDQPLTINHYLEGIRKEDLLYYACYYCNLAVQQQNNATSDIFWAFLNKGDIGTEYYIYLSNKVSTILNTIKTDLSILNIRTSLKFFELIQNRNDITPLEMSDIDVRKRLLKVYLLLNSDMIPQRREDLTETIIANSIVRELYHDSNDYQILLTQIIKASLFFEYCETKLPIHLQLFLNNFGLEKWQEYIHYLFQLSSIYIKSKDSVTTIYIPKDDVDYNKKSRFLDKFCLQETYFKDDDFTYIKRFPIIKDIEKEGYSILFPLFFYEKIYKCLYFILRDINCGLKNTESHIKDDTFKSDIGLYFSEKILLNRAIKDSVGKKYKHLGFDELKAKGKPDYYIRDGKHILLFECKDNLIKKSVIESADMDEFIRELSKLFVEDTKNSKPNPKAIKQLINNIKTIQKGDFNEDKGIKPSNCVIYPIIVVQNNIFSLSGINVLINDWFKTELVNQSSDLIRQNIKNITIIDIDTLIIFQGIFSQPKYSLRLLIDEYWQNYNVIDKKRNYLTPEDVVSDFPQKYQSFKRFVEYKLRDLNFFTKEILQYSSNIAL